MSEPLDDDDSGGGRGSKLRRWRRSLFDRRGGREEAATHEVDGAEVDGVEVDGVEADGAEPVLETPAVEENDQTARDQQAAVESAAAELEAARQAELEAAQQAAREAQLQEERAVAAREAHELAARDTAERVRDAEREAAEQAAAAHSLAATAADQAEAEAEAAAATAPTATLTPEPEPAPPAQAAPAPPAQAAPASGPPTSAPLPERPPFPLPLETVFEPWSGGWRGGRIVLDKLDVTTNRRLVNAALVEGINAEGPIHIERLARLIAASFEVRKLSPSRLTDIESMIPKSAVTTENGTICWPARVDPLQWNGFRSSGEPEARPTEHVSLRELANAMVAVLQHQGPLTETDLFGVTRRIFGGKRVTANVQTRMTAALDEAVAAGRLHRSGDTLRIV